VFTYVSAKEKKKVMKKITSISWAEKGEKLSKLEHPEANTNLAQPIFKISIDKKMTYLFSKTTVRESS